MFVSEVHLGSRSSLCFCCAGSLLLCVYRQASAPITFASLAQVEPVTGTLRERSPQWARPASFSLFYRLFFYTLIPKSSMFVENSLHGGGVSVSVFCFGLNVAGQHFCRHSAFLYRRNLG